jgi:hypothetical protein
VIEAARVGRKLRWRQRYVCMEQTRGERPVGVDGVIGHVPEAADLV